MILIYLGCTAIAAFALALVLGLTGARRRPSPMRPSPSARCP
jgi:MYXO-CTERM domain-containing protein